MIKKELLEFVIDKYGDLMLEEGEIELIAMFIDDIMKHEDVKLEEIEDAGSGKTSRNIKIGEYVLKVGYNRIHKNFRNSSMVLQPIIRREIENSYGDTIFLEVQNAVDTEWHRFERDKIFEIMYQVYKGVREEGMVWTDIQYLNIGKLLKDNKINYDTKIHDENGNIISKELEPEEDATGIKGKPRKILKAGDYVILDTDCIFDENDLPNGQSIKESILDFYYDNFELRYQKEKAEQEKEEKDDR